MNDDCMYKDVDVGIHTHNNDANVGQIHIVQILLSQWYKEDCMYKNVSMGTYTLTMKPMLERLMAHQSILFYKELYTMRL